MQICESSACTGCGACAQICPKAAISMKADERGFLHPVINDALCIGCHKCQNACHVLKEREPDAASPVSYVACAKNKELRLAGSSGALAGAFARAVFAQGGAVIGAIFDDRQNLYEDISFSYEDYIARGFSRSKYVQSETKDIFLKAKQRLNQSAAPLLFIGTPCLIAALKSFLGKEYENLLTIDFVCHGVPSPGVFQSYCRHLEKKYKSKISRVDFRVKKPSWALSSTVYTFTNGKKYKGNMMEDPYNVCFVNNNSIRTSCFDCHYATKARVSDITFCDYWGKREKSLTPDDDEYGVSAVMLHTPKGSQLFNDIKNEIYYDEISYKSVEAGNERLFCSTLHAQDSENFWKAYADGADFDALKPFCRSFLEGKTRKSKFMARYNYSPPIKFLRKLKKLLKP